MNAKPQSSPSSSSTNPGRDDAARIGKANGGDDTRNVGSEAKRLATDVAGQATETAERQLAGGKERAASAIEHLAGALRQTSEQLGATNMPMVIDYLGRAATQVEGLSTYVKQTSLRQVVGDLERFARREPVLFIGGAFVAGMLGGRFLKSAPPEQPQSSQRGQSARGGAEGAR